MKPWLDTGDVQVFHGDCVEVMRSLPDASVDAVVTDPPYGLGFMGKEWDAFGGVKGITDPAIRSAQQEKWGTAFGASARPAKPAEGEMLRYQLWSQAWATEALRVLKPGGHLLAFGGTRTWHRLAVAIEDAGFEVRDSIAWMYGSGFPKSLDVSKAIDKAAGAEREVVGTSKGVAVNASDNKHGGINRGAVGIKQVAADIPITAPATPAAQQWQGWGTALKPAFEPIVVARKPLIGTVAENVLAHGTGALNIDGCRIGTQQMKRTTSNGEVLSENGSMSGPNYVRIDAGTATGRWPANVILDESQAAELDRQSGVGVSPKTYTRNADGYGHTSYAIGEGAGTESLNDGDTGGASRFFYVPKANSNERPRAGEVAHPTVKPLDLMRYLVKLVTPPGGTVLEPFAGSGTTLEACVVEGFNAIGIEREADYLPLIEQRLTKPIQQVLA